VISQLAPDGTRTYLTILEWQHRRGGDAHCLAQLVFLPAGPPVAVLSELRSNTDNRGIMSDFAGVAETLLSTARPVVELPPAEVVWIAHHGAFSFYEAAGPETYLLMPLNWDGEHYHAVGEDRRLEPAELAETLRGAALEPVPEAVAQLGRQF
jgi:hypothetical protein